MNEREALLRAVCDNPDDDTPRLVFADWLQEHGDESDRARAEFIRVQIALAHRAAVEQEAALKSRERALLGEFGDRWLAPFRKYTSPGWGEQWWEFRRGFVEQMSVDEHRKEEFFAASEELFAQAPLSALWFPYLQDYQEVTPRFAQWSRVIRDRVRLVCGSGTPTVVRRIGGVGRPG